MRFSFWIMIAFLILSIIFKNVNPENIFVEILSLIFMISVVFTFITSIVHLLRYNPKVFPITSLVISTLLLVIFIIGVAIVLAKQIS